VCDTCGGEVYQRADDNETSIKERLNVYRNQTEPLIAFYRERKLLRPIQGSGSFEQIFERIKAALETKPKGRGGCCCCCG